jgi:O-antigen ligase
MSQRSVGIRLFYLGLVLVSFFYILLAQSRSSLFSLVGAMIVWQLVTWLLYKEDKGNYRKMLLIVFLVIVGASTMLFILYPEFFEQQYLSRLLSRFQLWGKILERVKDAPWFGHGLTADPRTEYVPGKILIHPHSVWVGTLFYGGIVGLLLFVAVLVSALWQGFGSVKQPINSVAACMVLYGALCIVPHGNMLIHHPKPFWLFFWFPLALVAASELPGHPLHDESRISNQRDAMNSVIGKKELF